MQHLIKYFRESHPNIDELTVDDAANFFRQFKMTFVNGFQEVTQKQNDNMDTAKDIEYLNAFIDRVMHSFMCGKPTIPLYDGVIVSKTEFERVINFASEQLRKTHEFNSQNQELSKEIEVSIAILSNEIYALNYQLNDE